MFKVEFNGMEFFFNETPTARALADEIFNDNYKIFEKGLKFEDGDIILDIGGNEGFFSILMAKSFPNARILSFEPVPRTFFQMVRNIGLNGVINVEPVNIGVGKDRCTAVMNVHNVWSGGSSLVDTFDPANHEQVEVAVVPLDALFASYNFTRVKLLKIDIEGGEYDALYNCECLPMVENVVAEFHINDRLTKRGFDMNSLATWVASKTNLLYFTRCKMAE